MADEVVRWPLFMRDFGKKVLVALRGGGIRRRLMVWGLSLFGIALTIVVVAGYSYTVRQIKKDAAQLQMEIASVTASVFAPLFNARSSGFRIQLTPSVFISWEAKNNSCS